MQKGQKMEVLGLDPASLLPRDHWLGLGITGTVLDAGQRPRQRGIGMVPAPDSFISQRRIFAELEMPRRVLNNVPQICRFFWAFQAE